MTIIDVAIVKSIGVHQPNYAVIQNNLASKLEQFILGVAGKENLSKDALHPNQNFMVLNDNANGCTFLGKVMLKNVVNFADCLNQFEERFLAD